MNTKLRFLALTAVGSMTAFAALLVACGDDDDTIDVPIPDSGTPDRNVADTGSDEDADAGSIAVPDGAAINTFRGQLETALCGSVARCCFGSSSYTDGGLVDASTYGEGAYFNGANCPATVRPLGFEKSTVGLDTATPGTVGIDAVKAVACISKLNALSCSLTGAELAAARADCFNAIVGLGAEGAACNGSMECANGTFCANPDGGTGVCTKLVGNGGACNVFPYTGPAVPQTEGEITAQFRNAQANEYACSTRAGGDTGLHCNSYNPQLVDGPTNPNGYRPQAEWRCVAGIANNDDGAGCNETVWCADGLCNTDPLNPGDESGDFVCRSPLNYFGTYGFCRGAVTVPDAGN